MLATNRFDVVVIGGGHDGLVTAGLLAKRGRRVIVLERRAVVGGAAITEQPWGPDFKVTALSYVMSLMPPTVLRELELEKHGYKMIRSTGPTSSLRRTAASCSFTRTRRDATPRLSKFSKRDADAMVKWDAWLGELGAFLGPLLGVIPPNVGSKISPDLARQIGLAWRLRSLDPRSGLPTSRG